jgi:hypothetical protein
VNPANKVKAIHLPAATAPSKGCIATVPTPVGVVSSLRQTLMSDLKTLLRKRLAGQEQPAALSSGGKHGLLIRHERTEESRRMRHVPHATLLHDCRPAVKYDGSTELWFGDLEEFAGCSFDASGPTKSTSSTSWAATC